MPVLKNKKHEEFAQAVANGASAAEAYRKHVAAKTTSPATIETNGPDLARSTQVALRISELRNEASDAASMSRQDMVKWLERILRAKPSEASEDSDICETLMTKAGPFTTLVSKQAAAEKLIKMAGWNEPEKHKLEVEVIIGGNAESQNQD